jgi:acyl carrier protein
MSALSTRRIVYRTRYALLICAGAKFRRGASPIPREASRVVRIAGPKEAGDRLKGIARIRGWSMTASQTFTTVARIISDTSDLSVEEIKPESNLMEDLGIDSLTFLDITFEIDQTFHIQLPVEKWMEEVNQGVTARSNYFQMSGLCAQIDRMVASQAAA